jgi:hypothetical protein
MFELFTGAAPDQVRTEPTSLLRLVAGEFAPALAKVWPDPHAEFLASGTARRHLACLALTVGRDLAPIAGVVLEGRIRQAIQAALDGAPCGLERALSRMGDTAWPAESYRRLLDLLADPAAAKALRHAEAIEPGPVTRLGLLPPAMDRSLALAQLITDDAARAVTEAAGAIACRSGGAAATAATMRWAELEAEAALFEAVREDLYPEPPAPPFPGCERLKPLATKAEMREAARRYDNCLATRVSNAVSGFSAFYEWTGGEGAVVEIGRDAIFGWRLEEAKGPRNAVLDKPTRAELVGDLTALGVYVGRSGWQLERALSPDTGRTWRLPFVEDDLADVFGD